MSEKSRKDIEVSEKHIKLYQELLKKWHSNFY